MKRLFSKNMLALLALSALCLPAAQAAEPQKPLAACLNGVATEIAPNPALYIKKGVKPKCSANTNIYYAQSPMGVVVAVNSNKGRNTFVGSSVSGKFVLHKACKKACTADEASAAVLEAVAAGAV